MLVDRRARARVDAAAGAGEPRLGATRLRCSGRPASRCSRSAAPTTACSAGACMSSLKMTQQEVKDEAQVERRQPGDQGARAPRAARDGHAAACCRPCQDGHRRRHQPDALRRGARVPPRQECRRPSSSPRAQDLIAAQDPRDRARARRADRREPAAGARALQGAPKSATRFPAPLFGAVAEVLAYLVRIKQLVL